MTNVVFRKLSGWLGAFACAGLLAACGGGGGSPGATPNNPGGGTSTAASVTLVPSATTIASSGQAGTEVTLTAQVKDSSNSAVAGATVKFTASSGAVGSVSGVSDANGVVTAKLSIGGDSSLRDIKVSASVGSVTSPEVVVKVVQATLTLTTDSGTLASSGTAEVTVTALVRDSNNSPMSGVKVDLAVDSGSLTVGTRVTDAQGRVSEKLTTGSDPTSREIKITGTIAGLPAVTASVSVVGTSLKVTANPTVNVGAKTDVSVKLVDSAGNPLANKPVTFSSGANSLVVKGGGAAVTNSVGQLTLEYTATSAGSGSDVITVRAMGEVASTGIVISAADFTVGAINGVGAAITVADINTCQRLKVRNFNGATAVAGSVLVTSSRGTVYTDVGCTSPMAVATALTNGEAFVYLKSANPGVATLTATMATGGATTQGALEFVAPLLPSATITLQADPAVIGTNATGSTSQQATIRAEVRDGTAANNLVKGATVAFSITSDASGGQLSQPAQVVTGSDGAATVSYIAGSATTPLNGVVIKGQLQGASTASATASLTVSKKSLFISAGTGRDVGIAIAGVYTKEYNVLVTDASGNAVAGVNITASVLPRHYRKGILEYIGANGPWQLPLKLVGTDPVTSQPIYALPYACPNEDANQNGVLDVVLDEDKNHNGRLDPGIPISVTSGGTTDATGRTTVTLSYARDQANWLGVDLTIRGQVFGSEATYVAYIPALPGAASEFSDAKISPPGQFSPYGTTNNAQASDCTIAN